MSALMARFQNYDDPNSLVFKIRKKRTKYIIPLIDKAFKEAGSCRIIDLGGEEWYWKIFDKEYLKSRNVSITLINMLPIKVEDTSIFKAVQHDACALSHIRSGEYDITHSNSVIEHVGDWSRMESFASEVRRVGKSYYVQTPNFWFPGEPHFGVLFIHWLPETARAGWMTRFRVGKFPKAPNLHEGMKIVQDQRLLSISQFRCLFPDAEIRREWWLGLPKSLIAIRH
jgi:hypothetical protein